MKTLPSFRYLCLMLASWPASWLWSCQRERDLQFVPTSEARMGIDAASSRGGGSLTRLSFFDDFASPTFAGEDGPVELVRWSDGSTRRTTTYAIEPPTIGTATLDGLRSNGFPYAFNPDATGWADTLTSEPHQSVGSDPRRTTSTSIFFYQGGGRGNAPDDNDSLVVEFAPMAEANSGGVGGSGLRDGRRNGHLRLGRRAWTS